jgi:hypothetical protein
MNFLYSLEERKLAQGGTEERKENMIVVVFEGS